MVESLIRNWKVYFAESVCLGLFMISASVFGTLLESHHSYVPEYLPNGFLRLVLMGVAMGITASLIIYSPIGKLSGAHMNPAVTVTFWWLGKIKAVDAIFYILFQCVGGLVGVLLMKQILGESFTEAPVNYVVTQPGANGAMAAFVVELLIAFITMTIILVASNYVAVAKYTGIIVGFLVASYVVVSGPVSGFSMNPARTIASAIPAMQFKSFWIYMTAPFIGMLSAALLYIYLKGVVRCAKLHHSSLYQCVFNCDYCSHKHVDGEIEIDK